MTSIRAVRTCLVAAAAFLLSLPAAETAPGEKIPLRILYAGQPGGERSRDFVEFLKGHFSRVDTADLKQLELRTRLEADVIVLDYDGDGFKAPRVSFPREYSQPTVTIGVAGGLICSQNRLKTGYL